MRTDRIKKFLFQNSNTRQTVAKNTFWLFASDVSSRLIKMILVIYAARVLGADGWGFFSYALSIGGLLSIFSDIGLSGLITREMAQKKEGYEAFVSTALIIKMAIVFASAIAIAVIGPVVSRIPEARVLFPAVAALALFDALREFALAINRASERMEREMIAKTITGVSILVFGLIFLYLHPTSQAIAAAYAIGSGIGFLSIAYIMRKDVKRLFQGGNKNLVKEILRTTWPFAIIMLIGGILSNTDVYMLGIWWGPAEIGFYSAVQRIQQFSSMIPAVISVAVFPLMSRLAHEGKEQFSLILEKTLRLMLVVALPIAIGGILFAYKIVPLIFGQAYIGAVPTLQVLMLLVIPSFPLTVLSNAIFAKNNQRKLTGAYFLGVAMNIVLNLFLVPRFGAVGASLSTLLSTCTITCFIWIELRKDIEFHVFRKLARPAIAGVVMVIATLILQKVGAEAILTMAVVGLTYFGVLFLLREPLLKEAMGIFKK